MKEKMAGEGGTWSLYMHNTVYMCNLDSKNHEMWKGVMGMRLVVVTGHTNLRDD